MPRREPRPRVQALSGWSLKNFQRRLLVWFRRHRRDLPWRRTRDPYRIWVSESMLQQTRVAAVLPYYRRFLRRFPTVAALARAGPQDVLRHWAGLGYYSRARNLHTAAKLIVARHAGRFPNHEKEAMALPGVGRYTSAAVLSMAYGAPLAVLDGNVARVLARLGAVRGDIRAPHRWRALQQTAQRILLAPSAGDWNQAMMELGATLCTPRSPRCADCPVSRSCRAYALGAPDRFPAARRKSAPRHVEIAAAVLLDPRGRTLLLKQTGAVAALFSRMWQFPAVQVARDAQSELRRHVRAICGMNGVRVISLPAARHTVTFHEITLQPFLLRVTPLPPLPHSRRVPLAKINTLSISNATRKIARSALAAL